MQATCAAARRAHDRMDENARAHSLRARDRGYSRIAAFTDAINCTAHKTGRQLTARIEARNPERPGARMAIIEEANEVLRSGTRMRNRTYSV
jgi:hypothetical protein